MKQHIKRRTAKTLVSTLLTTILPITLGLSAAQANAAWTAHKKVTIAGTTYGLYKAEDTHGAFVDFSIDTSTDGGATWSGSPTTILSANDLAGQGEDSTSDYTRSILRSVKWVQCPGSNTWSLWVKRHGIDANNELIVRKELLRASGSFVNTPYTDNIIIDRPYGYSSGDLGTVIENGVMHILSAATDEGAINIYAMNDTCSDLVPEGPAVSLEWHLDDGEIDHREAPSLMEENGYFYLVTSGKTSWRPNQQKVSYATTLSGPWSDLVNVGDSTAYHSQLFGVKKYTATNGSGNSVRVFSGTRNQEMWNGQTGSPKIQMPWYWNTPTAPASNFYDETIVDPETAEITTVQYDHGTRLNIANAELVGYADFLDYLIDSDESTSWHNNDKAEKNIIEFDLGDTHNVKAVKVKLYDFYNNLFHDVTNRVVKVRIEVGDGATYTQVFEDIIPTIEWLQPINFADTTGSKIRMTLLESHSGNHVTTNMHWGFYEVQAWGDTSAAAAIVKENFNDLAKGSELTGWNIEKSADTSALIQGNNRRVELTDNNSSGRIRISKEFLPQYGSKVQFSFKIKPKQLASGEYVRLKGGELIALELTNSTQVNGLAIVNSDGSHTKVTNLGINSLVKVTLNINTDAGTYDVFIDDNIVWGGAVMQNDVSFVDEIMVGTPNGATNLVTRFDNITIKAPIRDLAQPIPTLFVTDFEAPTTLADWTAVSGTWERKWNAAFDSTVLRNSSTTSNDIAMAGDATWEDYDVSARVRRENPAVALLGRYNSPTQYYQLQIKRDNTFQLSRMNNGNWLTLSEGEFINADFEFHQLKLSFRGNEINAYIDGNLVATAIDTVIPSGAIALKTTGTGSNNFDDVIVSQ